MVSERFDYDAAEPRARDAWIAEHVMEWDRETGSRDYWWCEPGFYGVTPHTIHVKHTPHFTTDATAEWQAVRAFRGRRGELWCQFTREVALRNGWPGEWTLSQFLRTYQPGLLCRAMWKALEETNG